MEMSVQGRKQYYTPLTHSCCGISVLAGSTGSREMPSSAGRNGYNFQLVAIAERFGSVTPIWQFLLIQKKREIRIQLTAIIHDTNTQIRTQLQKLVEDFADVRTGQLERVLATSISFEFGRDFELHRCHFVVRSHIARLTIPGSTRNIADRNAAFDSGDWRVRNFDG